MTNKNATITCETLNATYNFNLPEIYSAFMDFCNFEALDSISDIVNEWGIQIDAEQEISDEDYDILSTVMSNGTTLIDFYDKITFKTNEIKDSLGIELVGIFRLIIGRLMGD